MGNLLYAETSEGQESNQSPRVWDDAAPTLISLYKRKATGEFCLKCILDGDWGVGKTAILNRYVLGTFSTTYKSTIGVDFLMKPMNVNGNKVNIQVWDAAQGPERFHSVSFAYYRNTSIALVIFDPLKPTTWTTIAERVKNLQTKCGLPEGVLIALVCNKIDLAPQLLDDPWVIESNREILCAYKYPTSTASFWGNSFDRGSIWSQLPLEIVHEILKMNPARRSSGTGLSVSRNDITQFARQSGLPLFWTSAKTGFGIDEMFKELTRGLEKTIRTNSFETWG